MYITTFKPPAPWLGFLLLSITLTPGNALEDGTATIYNKPTGIEKPPAATTLPLESIPITAYASDSNPPQSEQDGLVTIYDNPNFVSLRTCGQQCFVYLYAYGTTTDRLGDMMGCSISTLKSLRMPLNNCYCRPDLQTLAHEQLSSCVSTRCPWNEGDITTAQMVYDDYCQSNGYFAQTDGPQSTPVAGGDGGGNGGGNNGDGGNGGGPDAAPGATGTQTQGQATGVSRFGSAGNYAAVVSGRGVLLFLGVMVSLNSV